MLFNRKFHTTMGQEGGGSAVVLDENNYEYYFLLYIDGETSLAEKLAVENFLAQYPFYQTAFDQLVHSKLPAEQESFDSSFLLRNTSIDDSNYEKYFLLYIDKELTKEETKKLLQFLAVNPSKEIELEVLLQTKLKDPAPVFNKTTVLRSGHPALAQNSISEWLSLYMDGETSSEQNTVLGNLITNDPVVEKELELLLKTKLAPLPIAYPGKQSLYRKETTPTRVFPIWLRYAAAACILFVFVLWIGQSGVFKTAKVSREPLATAKNPVQDNYNKPGTPLKVTREIPENNSVATNGSLPTTIPAKQNLAKTSLHPENVNLPLKENKIVTKENNQRITNNNDVANKTVLINNTVVKQDVPDNDLIFTKGKTIPLPTDTEIAKMKIEPVPSKSLYASFASTAEKNQEEVSILNIDTDLIDKKGKVKNLKNKIGNYLKGKINTLTNTTIGVGRYEIAMAK